MKNQKKCGTCKKVLPLSSFYKLKSGSNGVGSRCKGCDNKARRRYYEDNKTQCAVLQREYSLKSKYGITIQNYDDLLKSQGGSCAICESTDAGSYGLNVIGSFAVDHCHSSGVIRGLLCNRCNRAIGLLKDDPYTLFKAVDYLTKGSSK